MKALIVAAGRGTRLAPLTDNCPKPMLPIAGVPMVERIMAGIAREADITEFVLVTGYKSEVIRDYFGDGSAWGWQVQYAHQETPQGLAQAVHCAHKPLQDAPFFMTYGDIMLSSENYGRFAALPRTETQSLLGLNWVEDPYLGAAVYRDDQGWITQIQEKPPRGTATTHWNSAGLFVFPPVIFDFTARLKPSARGEYELPDAVAAMIRDGYPVQGVELTGIWRDVGTREDYDAINREFGAGEQ